MDKFNPPDPLIFDGNIREHCKGWKKELELYLVATEKDRKKNKVNSIILLSWIGPQGREIYNTVTFSAFGEIPFSDILCPKNISSVAPKTHLFLFSFKPDFRILFKTSSVRMSN